MNVCMYVCTYVCMYACMYVCIYIYIYIYTYTYICLSLSLSIYIYIYIWTVVIQEQEGHRLGFCERTCVHRVMSVPRCVCIYVLLYCVYIYIYIYTYIHTYIHREACSKSIRPSALRVHTQQLTFMHTYNYWVADDFTRLLFATWFCCYRLPRIAVQSASSRLPVRLDPRGPTTRQACVAPYC